MEKIIEHRHIGGFDLDLVSSEDCYAIKYAIKIDGNPFPQATKELANELYVKLIKVFWLIAEPR